MSERSGARTTLGRWAEREGVSYGQLARDAGVTRSTVIRVATARLAPRAATALAISQRTGIPVATLLRESTRGR